MWEGDNISNAKIAVIGDSITYGFPYEPAQSWLTIAAERLCVDYINSGINGDTTGGMASRFSRDVLRHQPTHVIIMGGTNDAYLQYDAGQVAGNIRYMSELALEKGIIPIIGLPIPCNDMLEERLLAQYRKEMRSYAAGRDIALIDFYAAMADESGARIRVGLDCDGVHPSVAGYKIMAGVAVTALYCLIRVPQAELGQ